MSPSEVGVDWFVMGSAVMDYIFPFFLRSNDCFSIGSKSWASSGIVAVLGAILQHCIGILSSHLKNFFRAFANLHTKLHSRFLVCLLTHNPLSKHLLLKFIGLLEVTAHISDFLHRLGEKTPEGISFLYAAVSISALRCMNWACSSSLFKNSILAARVPVSIRRLSAARAASLALDCAARDCASAVRIKSFLPKFSARRPLITAVWWAVMFFSFLTE